MKDFLYFIRKQGVVGLATGFILGGAVSKLVASLVEDIINPILGIILGKAGDLSSYSWWVGSAEIKWGNFLTMIIDFVVIAAVVYFGFKGMGLDRLDFKHEAEKELKLLAKKSKTKVSADK
jgi:large conductance mechanosensitive channel